MAWTIYSVPSGRRTELDAVLKDDEIARQSQKLRDAPALGGPAGTVLVLIEGNAGVVAKADSLLAPLGTKFPPAEADAFYRKFKDEDEAASAGMGLFFTE